MEAEPVDRLPTGEGWLFEPKYDGFRCLAFRAGQAVQLQSKRQKPLDRFFPELLSDLAKLRAERFVIDGEIIIVGQPFETLQLRLHPAASRVERLAQQHPATLAAFDLLVDGSGASLAGRPFAERRRALERFVKSAGQRHRLALSDATGSRAEAKSRWLGKGGAEGIMAKRLDLPYRPGERAMAKFKLWKTVDCVVAGLYLNDSSGLVESLLLGLYDKDGLLHYVGRAPVHKEAKDLTRRLRPLIGGPGFSGRAPGGKSRWTGKERKPVPLRPELVVEVSADHITSDYMRHGSRVLRWRTDKRPETCTIDQIR